MRIAKNACVILFWFERFILVRFQQTNFTALFIQWRSCRCLPVSRRVQSRRQCKRREVRHPFLHLSLSSSRAKSISTFLNILISASGLHCTSLRIPVRSKSASFSSRQKQTSPPGTGTAASFACSVHTPLTSFKVWRHSPQNRREQRPQRRHCVSAQLHGTAMIALAPSTAL